ncbi:MAG: type I DNA topoisomerase [Verrucomicrobiota bacterium]|nr:type I DNA topoisomerase [Verrucomicrobiota bacterium]MDD8051005.1 type I DNA topoisomerase [Verrucomicrobiota bacterium]MDI9384870.1 type I DNA topoisomerase [Verrucomicrobiota bacterium]
MGKGSKSLVIVESPAKAKTINKILGDAYEVKASMGHVRDLPAREFGVDIEQGFAPKYVPVQGRKDILGELTKSAQKSDQIFLAPDPDREGEAIAWHLREALEEQGKLKGKPFFRVTFNEITKDAVSRAFETPREIDMAKVDSQQARRILDRLVGYKLSPLLWKKVGRGLSAGRVQSVAVRLVCEREDEVRAFQPEEYWTLDAALTKREGDAPEFLARLARIDGEKATVSSGAQMDAILRDLEAAEWSVAEIGERERKRSAAPPFTTSTLQQAASSRLRLTTRQTMSVAQELYEGIDLDGSGPVGLITYMRTDSVNIAKEAQDHAREFIRERFSPEYVPEKPNIYRSRAGAQAAHEAVRPSEVTLTPEDVRIKRSLTPRQLALYRLIWERFVASQMAPARFKTLTVEIDALPSGGSPSYRFRSSSTQTVFEGFLKAFSGGGGKHGAAKKKGKAEEDPDQEPSPDALPETEIPPLAEAEALDCQRTLPEQHFTQPPPRYTEASLVRALEENGVGRPSTYAPTISTILQRKYVDREDRTLHPTSLGETVNRLLVEHFPDLVNVEFTSKLETDLDQIEEGHVQRGDLLEQFYTRFAKTLELARETMDNMKAQVQPTDLKCELCGLPMVIRWSKNGEFLSCSGFPGCRNAKSFRKTPEGKIEVIEAEVTEHVCPKCNRPMAVRTGKFGRFLACTGYPECKTTMPIPTGVACPREGCGGMLVERFNKRKKRFYGCSNYPACQYITQDLQKLDDPEAATVKSEKVKSEKAKSD